MPYKCCLWGCGAPRPRPPQHQPKTGAWDPAQPASPALPAAHGLAPAGLSVVFPPQAFCSGPPGLPLIHAKYIFDPYPIVPRCVAFRGSLATPLAQKLPGRRLETKAGGWQKAHTGERQVRRQLTRAVPSSTSGFTRRALPSSGQLPGHRWQRLGHSPGSNTFFTVSSLPDLRSGVIFKLHTRWQQRRAFPDLHSSVIPKMCTRWQKREKVF